MLYLGSNRNGVGNSGGNGGDNGGGSNPGGVIVDFTSTTPEIITELDVFNATIANVRKEGGRFRSELTAADNVNNATTFFNLDQGELWGWTQPLQFPFTVDAFNIGVGTVADSQQAITGVSGSYRFCGLQVHKVARDGQGNVDNTLFVNDINYSHLVIGNRDGTFLTGEGKYTVNGVSTQNDLGWQRFPTGRGDLRVVGTVEPGSPDFYRVTWYYKQPGAADWIEYGTQAGTLPIPGTHPTFGIDVEVGIVVYAYTNLGLPFVGTCDYLRFEQQ